MFTPCIQLSTTRLTKARSGWQARPSSKALGFSLIGVERVIPFLHILFTTALALAGAGRFGPLAISADVLAGAAGGFAFPKVVVEADLGLFSLAILFCLFRLLHLGPLLKCTLLSLMVWSTAPEAAFDVCMQSVWSEDHAEDAEVIFIKVKGVGL